MILVEVKIMLIHAVCKECSLTKKAIEYYIDQKLIYPAIQNNGYRDFSDEDIIILKKISVLRNLGLSVSDIRNVLSHHTTTALNEIYNRNTLQMTVLQEKQKLIQELAQEHNWEEIQDRLSQLQKKQTILERLMNAFPGYYGKFLCLHFAPYLNEPVLTEEQQKAFDTIICFLDGVDFDIPAHFKTYLDDSFNFDEEMIKNISNSVNAAIHDIEKYIADNHKAIENYMEYQQSAEYQSTPAYQLKKILQQFNSTSGYNEVFIPAMRKLSKSYRKYYEELSKANEKFIEKYPELKPES